MCQLKDIFSCKRCGFCCQGETTVSLTSEDLKRMVSGLEMIEADVFEKYLRVHQGVVQMKTVNGHCVFYNDGCSVHNGRPWRCMQWPFHPSILKDENNFITIKDSCPGINRAISYVEFCRVISKLTDENGLLLC